MTRVKRGKTVRRRHKRILKQAKGYWGAKHRSYRRAKEQLLHSWQYAYRDRKARKRQFRRLWTIRINAAARALGVTYSQMISGLKAAGTSVNRKMLAELAARDLQGFQQLVEVAKKANKDIQNGKAY